MSVDRTWLGILCVACCAPSITLWTRARVNEFRRAHGSPAAAPLRFADACLDGSREVNGISAAPMSGRSTHALYRLTEEKKCP
jgi:hypothetical protein